MQRKRVFISYSWDSKEHQQWVLYLANQLREKGGIHTDTDVFETQQKSVNLYKMMVDKMRDSDYIIIVLTENYARKANAFHGGVGFESQLTLPLLMENPEKLIPIMIHQGDYQAVFPFHLKGFHAIDFSNDEEYNDRLMDLIYRINDKPRYYVAPVGDIPSLEPVIPARPTKAAKEETELTFSIPNLKRITDKDKDEFLTTSYKVINRTLESIFEKVRTSNPNFDFTAEHINQTKVVFSIYLDGSLVRIVRLLMGAGFHSNSISILYGNSHYIMSDTSSNEMIVCEVTSDNELILRPLMQSFSRKVSTPSEIALGIWEDHIVKMIK